MGKLLLIPSAGSIGLLLALQTIAPESSIMWIASQSSEMTTTRAILFVVLLALLVSRPPRNKLFRVSVGAMAILVATTSLSATYHNNMEFLDGVSMLLFSISAGIAALEIDSENIEIPSKTSSASA